MDIPLSWSSDLSAPVPGYCGDLPREAGELLLRSAESRDDGESLALLEEAHHRYPEHFAIFLGLYKFHFYRQRFAEAEAWMRKGLTLAAGKGGSGESADEPDDAQRFYRFTLKALAFTLLRRRRFEEARSLLDELARLDPRDQVGAGLIRAAAEAI